MPPSPSAKRPSRVRAEERGRGGESLAAWYLRLKGYAIVARRYKTPAGEIDLVALRGGSLVFVEVKARQRRSDFGAALAAVNTARIARGAAYYLSRHPRRAGLSQRFDVIFLAPLSWPRHVKGAFDAS